MKEIKSFDSIINRDKAYLFMHKDNLGNPEGNGFLYRRTTNNYAMLYIKNFRVFHEYKPLVHYKNYGDMLNEIGEDLDKGITLTEFESILELESYLNRTAMAKELMR